MQLVLSEDQCIQLVHFIPKINVFNSTNTFQKSMYSTILHSENECNQLALPRVNVFNWYIPTVNAQLGLRMYLTGTLR